MVSCYVINIKKLAVGIIGNGENATQSQRPVGVGDGSLYLVQKPALRGYTWIRGELLLAIAISAQLGENATPNQVPCTAVHGLLYLVPNQALRG
jgi:hypothetical protein